MMSSHSITSGIDILAVAILVTAFLIVSSRSLTFYVRLFSLQSFLLGIVALLVVIGYNEPHILIAAILTLALKAFVLPAGLNRIIEKIQVHKEVKLSINITTSLLMCGLLVILADSISSPILEGHRAGIIPVSRVLPSSIAMMLIGLFIMISRKQAVSQIVGLLTMENGLFLCGLSITYGMPLIVEVGIFFDVMVAVLILGLFVFRINQTFDTINIDTLRGLRH